MLERVLARPDQLEQCLEDRDQPLARQGQLAAVWQRMIEVHLGAEASQFGGIAEIVGADQPHHLIGERGEQAGELRRQVDALALELDAEFEAEPVDARCLADVGPPANLALGEAVGEVVRLGDLPAFVLKLRDGLGGDGAAAEAGLAPDDTRQ